ncbi:protein halfway [Zeugodacus cucurbitae]|uniref:protein halfway n=1 Tax=Zeugodacus cucurbitae TaxID=28588 RepID=UPI0023D94F2D|nr:protein halfway [Zeugodacus cucurbitae]
MHYIKASAGIKLKANRGLRYIWDGNNTHRSGPLLYEPTQSHLLFVVICLLCWPGFYALPHPAEELPMTFPQEPNGVIEYHPQCFYAEEELCDKTLSNWQQQTYDQHTRLGTCHCRPYTNMPTSWYCCNITHMSMISSCSNTTTWTNLHLRNVTLPELDLSNFLYQKLQSLAITDGKITKLVGSFSRFSSIKCLNVSNNNLSEITQRGLIPPTLKVLDISKNNLTSIPNFNQNQNITVDVSGNNNLVCYDMYKSIFSDSLKFVNQQNSYCLHNANFGWFNSTELISMKELVKMRSSNTDCPSIPGYGNCTCKYEYLLATLSIISKVDCSNLGLIELPPKLPENTFSLNVSNNKITSIGKHFHTNPTYRNLIDLIADNNNISNIYDFEGTAFMDHFQKLYLRNNAISSPTQSHLLFVVICLLCWPGFYALPHPAEELPMAFPQEPNEMIDFQPPSPPTLSPLPKIDLPTADSEIIEYRPLCFYADKELCDKTLSNWQQQTYDQQTHLGTCHCRPYTNMPTSWYCCNITHMSMISSCSNTTTWTNLHLRNVTLAELDLSNFLYQKLQSLAITDGNITKLVGSFSRFSSIKCLNVSNNNLSEITQRGLIPPTLKVLDISKNNLTSIPNINQNQNITVDVSGNNNLLCYDIYNSIISDSLKFVNQQNSYCLLNFTFRWFNSTELISIKELVKLRSLNTDCPSIPGYGNCTCKYHTLSGDLEATTKTITEVDCSNLGLIELPPKLPENTFWLNVSNNKITNIGKHFHTNPTYRNLNYLIANNNNISNIYDFEGTAFMEHFQRLYLRNNAISSIPEYFLSNVLDNHDDGRIIFLGGNELKCDCNSAKRLKYWLLEHNRDIPDYNSIRCRNLPQNVMELREEKLCQSPHD